MIKNLTFSVITPSLNQGSFIEENIRSVIDQNYENVEHLIIDGGSTDQTLSILNKYEKQLAFWVSEADTGQSQAINKGLKKASGEIIMWLNSDDVLMPDSINKVNRFFSEHPETALLHGRSVFFGQGQKEILMGEIANDLKPRYLAYMPFPQPSSFFRKSLIEKIGNLNEDLHYGMDYELLVRTLLSNSNIEMTDAVLSKYRIHAASKTNEKLKFPQEWATVFSKVLRSFDFSAELIAVMKTAGIYNSNTDTFTRNLDIEPMLLKKALLYHLTIQAHYHYNMLDLRKTKSFLEVIHDTDKEFYSDNSLGLLNLKSTYLPAAVIRVIRKIIRN